MIIAIGGTGRYSKADDYACGRCGAILDFEPFGDGYGSWKEGMCLECSIHYVLEDSSKFELNWIHVDADWWKSGQ